MRLLDFALAGFASLAATLCACDSPSNPAPTSSTTAAVGASSASHAMSPSARSLPSLEHCPANLAKIPGGSFGMGVNMHSVSVDPFCMDLTEVTVDAYAKCIDANKCSEPTKMGGPKEPIAKACNWKNPGHGGHPVNCVDFQQAGAYCAFVGERLPTEAEWEWAARNGSKGAKYPWGDDGPKDQLCWNGAGSIGGAGKRVSTCAVGSHAPDTNAWDVKDLAGNVGEWTSTSAGLEEGRYVVKGAAWDEVSAPNVPVGNRGSAGGLNRENNIGFRCVKTP